MSKRSELTSGVMVNMNYQIPDELHRRVKMLAASRGVTVKALLIEALQQIVEAAEDTENI